MLLRKFLFCLLFSLVFSVVSELSAEPPIEVIYFKPSDVQTPSQNELDSIHEVMVEVQSFFASEMERYGFGPKTFDFNTDIAVVEGKRKLHQYTEVWQIQNEYPSIEFGLDNATYVVFLGGATSFRNAAAVSQQLCANIPKQLKYCNNLILLPADRKPLLEPLAAHEIGHAFGLDHPPERLIKNRVDVMYFPLWVTPGVKEELKNYALNREHATFLDKDDRLFIQEDSQDLNIKIDADVNDDGYVDLSDVLIVRSGTQNTTSYDTDVNDDGVTNEIDVMLVKAIAVEAIAAVAPSKRRFKLATTWGKLKIQ